MAEKTSKVPQIYGYTVCVIAVITFLICAAVVVNNVFDLANPIQASFGMESTFEAYKATNQKDLRPGTAVAGAAPRADTLPDSVLRARYEALRSDRIARNRFQSWKAITASGLMLVISVLLFVLHWRWMKKVGGEAAS